MQAIEGIHRQAVQEAIEILGSQQALANAINDDDGSETVKQSHINKWLCLVKVLPVERAFQIEKATKGLVKKEQVRPDFFKKYN